MDRDEFKDRVYLPRGKWEYTKEEKRKNWVRYNLVWVLAGIAAAAVVLSIVLRALGVGVTKPDYCVAVVSSGAGLPDEMVQSLQEALTSFGQDLNGDGKVVLEVRQYANGDGLDPETDYYYTMAGSVRLQADLMSSESYIFLMDDPKRFQEMFQVLTDESGALPEEDDYSVEGRTIPWTDCPALRDLPLDENAQKVFSGYAIGRRGFADLSKVRHYEENEALWAALTAGAVR